jgi:phage recombination protein Bet
MTYSQTEETPMSEQKLSIRESKQMFSAEQRRMIRQTYAYGASEGEFSVLMGIAEARNLNPLLRQVFFVKRWDSVKREEVWSVQVSIDGLRSIAQRTGEYDGQDAITFQYEDKDGRLWPAKVPGSKIYSAEARIYRRGCAHAFPATAFWSEYAQVKKDGSLTAFWATKPHIMLGKCAEALALRKAFPEDLAGLYSEEEMPDIKPEAKTPSAESRLSTEAEMMADLEAGFFNWEQKRRWGEAHKVSKTALSPEAQERLRIAFINARPSAKEASPALPPVEPPVVPEDAEEVDVLEPGHDG